MSKRHIPDSHTSHPNVTPLIDIIMCLIIFFMLVAKIGVTTGAEEVDIPSSFLGKKIDDMSNTFTVNIKEQTDPGDIVVTATVDNVPQTLQLAAPSGQNQLTNVLKKLKDGNPQEKVIIRADAKLEWQYISPVLDSCNDAGILTVAYNTKEATK
jgi:biopolymer transport protein ExbD